MPSAQRVGPTDKTCGLDMTAEMLAVAWRNKEEAGIEQRRVHADLHGAFRSDDPTQPTVAGGPSTTTAWEPPK